MVSSHPAPPPSPRTIQELAEAYRAESTRPVAATKEYLRRIERLNPKLNCFITVLADSALKAAASSEQRFKSGNPLGPLDGIPVAIKDIIYIEGVRCTAGSRILANNVATYDAPVVKKLKESGAVIVGTTNLHEFAAGVTSENPHYGPVRNPWDVSHIAGGSSGGSAAAVASNLSTVAIGTDTAGSVRIPAALCGVLGLKPTYGRVSRLGVIPLATSLDTVGVLSTNAWDAAATLQVIAGREKEDVTTVDAQATDYIDGLSLPFKGARIGIVRDYSREFVDPRVEEALGKFISKLGEVGCTAHDVEIDVMEQIYGKWLLIRRAEATAFHLAWLESSPELYGEDVRKLMELGKDVRAIDYVNALNARPSMTERFVNSMNGIDFLALPSTCVSAPLMGQRSVEIKGKEVEVYSALNRLTLPFNYLGFPALSIPSGFAGGLPVGVQIVGRLFDEAGVMRLAHAYEQKFGPHPAPVVSYD
ncbi:MAG TPA: amidase [Nitrososphaerales archaeon]|nr:amidase [Nitrososphaerales archaeon]